MRKGNSRIEDLHEKLDHLSEELSQFGEQLYRIEERQKRGPKLPSPARKYTYEEAGVRLTTGRDAMGVPEHWDDCLSAKSVRRLTTDGDCPLRAGGQRTVRITEASIQQYERGVEHGQVDGYQLKKPRSQS